MLITKTHLIEWKKAKVVFYLGKPIWKKTFSENWKGKVPALKKNKTGKTRWNSRDKTDTSGSFITSKKYAIYDADTGRKEGIVTLEDVKVLTKAGIKVLAEKDGFAC